MGVRLKEDDQARSVTGERWHSSNRGIRGLDQEMKEMFDPSTECDAVLARYGLAQCSMTTIGAEKTRGLPLWGVEITCHGSQPEFFEVLPASQLADDLRRVGEK